MFQIREAYTPPIFITRPILRRAATSIGYLNYSDETYTDANGKTWDIIGGEHRGVILITLGIGGVYWGKGKTAAYGGVETPEFSGTRVKVSASVYAWINDYTGTDVLGESDPAALDGTDLDDWSSTVVSEDTAEEAAIEADSTISEDAKTTKKATTAKKVAPPAPPTSAGAALLKQVQSSLISLGYDLGPSGADGKIGPFTRGAITKFKVDHGIVPTDATINEAFRKALAGAVTEKKTGVPSASAAGSGTSIAIVLAVVAAVAAGIYFFVK